MDLALAGKTALVAGGSRGIGRAITLELAKEGVDVAILARERDQLETTASEISSATGRRILPFVADTRNDVDIRSVVESIVSRFGRIDILVNSAAQPGGHAPAPKYNEITTELFWDDMNTKVMGYLRCAREVAPHMIRQGWGRIVNVSGLGARQAGAPLGSMRNIAVVALTKNLSDELGPKGINVSCVHPGVTRTERTAGVLALQAQAAGITVEEAERRLAETNDVRRVIDASEVADVVVFLCSPRSSAISGDVVAVGGGGRRAIFP